MEHNPDTVAFLQAGEKANLRQTREDVTMRGARSTGACSADAAGCCSANAMQLGSTAATVTTPFTFRHRASSIKDRRFVTLQRTLFIY